MCSFYQKVEFLISAFPIKIFLSPLSMDLLCGLFDW